MPDDPPVFRRYGRRYCDKDWGKIRAEWCFAVCTSLPLTDDEWARFRFTILRALDAEEKTRSEG